MKYSILYFIFLLLSICGCKKSSLPGSPLNTLTSGSPNNSDTISHVQSGGWSFQINGGSVLGGDVTTCLVVQGSSSNRHQLIMSGPVANNRYSLALAMDMPSTVPVVGSYVACPSTNNQIQINYEYA